jgi:hypothetical protein
MSLQLSTLRLIARILLAAILLQAAGPVLAAYQHKTGAHWTEICSTSGSKWVASKDVDKTSGAGMHVGSDHCVFCGSTGAAHEFDASYYLPACRSSNLPFSGVQFDTASRYAGHAILSRAPPTFLI